MLEVCTQICRWSNMSAKVQSEEWQQQKKKGEAKFSKMHVQDLSHQRAGRQRRWQQLTGTALSQAHELSMHGQATMLTFLKRGGGEAVCGEHLSPVSLFLMAWLMKPYICLKN